MRRTMLALLLVMVLTTAFPAEGAAPPVSREAVKRDLKRAELLEGQAFQHALAGRFADALKVDQETLRLRLRWLPEKHRLVQRSKQDVENWARLADLPSDKQKQLGTALRLNGQGATLFQQGKYKDAERLCHEALEIHRKVLGEEHPDTATSYSSVAVCLTHLGQHGMALPLVEKALRIRLKVLGEQHPHTAASYNNVAFCLWRLDRIAEATRLLQRSLPGQEVARFHKAGSGFDRALASRGGISPGELLALGLARHHQPQNAFVHADSALARALLDDLIRGDTDVTSLRTQLARLDDRLLPLFGRANLSRQHIALREELIQQRRELTSEIARRTTTLSARQLLSLADIQKQVPAPAALVFWIDAPALNEYQACIVRHQGTPVWVRLTGSGKDGKWTQEERNLHDRLFQLLNAPQAASTLERQNAMAALHKLRLAPRQFRFFSTC